MATFIDGPAAEVSLDLRRAPIMLRVVQSNRGNWDALDQLDDVARPTERIFVYRMVGEPTWFCIRSGRGRGRIPEAKYQYLPDQPADAHVRTNEAWASWCESNRERLTAGMKVHQ